MLLFEFPAVLPFEKQILPGEPEGMNDGAAEAGCVPPASGNRVPVAMLQILE